MTREKIEEQFPGLIQELVDHPGIGVVVVRSEDGLVAIGDTGTSYLDDGRVTGTDPLAVYGPNALEGLRDVSGFDNSGDMIVIGAYDQATQEVVSFEELIGSHGGLGGVPQDHGATQRDRALKPHLIEGPIVIPVGAKPAAAAAAAAPGTSPAPKADRPTGTDPAAPS